MPCWRRRRSPTKFLRLEQMGLRPRAPGVAAPKILSQMQRIQSVDIGKTHARLHDLSFRRYKMWRRLSLRAISLISLRVIASPNVLKSCTSSTKVPGPPATFSR